MSKATLVEFLVNRFGSDELRRLMSYNYPDVTQELPGPTASPASVADTCAEVLRRKGHLDAEFFVLLRRERPKFVAEIDRLERAAQAEREAAAQVAEPAEKATKKTAKKAAAKPKRPPGKSAYRWLHLTDLHFGARGQAVWVQMVDDFEHSLEVWLKKLGGPIDLVLVTGDLTNRGSKAEFDGVSAFFDRILKQIADQQGHAPLLVAVPGNHDLVRPKEDDLLDFAAFDLYVKVGELQGQRLHERLWTSKNPGRVAELFAEYSRWMDHYMLPKLAASGSGVQVHRSFFPGDLTVTLELPGRFPLGIVGLNSAWLQYQGGEFEGKLALPAEQFQAALPPGGSALDYFRQVRQALLMHHHPPAWLSPKQQEIHDGSIYVPRRFAACLFGHMHKAAAERRAAAGGDERVVFQTPSLFGLEDYGQQRESRLFGYAFGCLREDGELLAWPLRCEKSGNGEYQFVRDTRFHWRDDEHVLLRQGS